MSLTIAIVGNPNVGKTELFNALTGLSQRTGNYPGVTVRRKSGDVQLNGTVGRVVDLPGSYSLAARSPDEMVVAGIEGEDRQIGQVGQRRTHPVVVVAADEHEDVHGDDELTDVETEHGGNGAGAAALERIEHELLEGDVAEVDPEPPVIPQSGQVRDFLRLFVIGVLLDVREYAAQHRRRQIRGVDGTVRLLQLLDQPSQHVSVHFPPLVPTRPVIR